MAVIAVFLQLCAAACLVRLSTFQLALAGCYRGWHGWRDSCYLPVGEKLSWPNATSVCRRSSAGGGSSMLVPDSPEEHGFVEGKFVEWFGADHEPGEMGLWIGCQSSNQTLGCLGGNEDEVLRSWQGDPLPTEPSTKCVFKALGGNLNIGRCRVEKFVVCEMPSRPSLAPRFCVSLGADGRPAPQRCPRGRGIAELAVTGVGECVRACWAEPRCRSFSVRDGAPAKICQLNNGTSEATDGDGFTEEGGCVYFEV